MAFLRHHFFQHQHRKSLKTHHCIFSMYQPITSMNCSFLGIILLEVFVPKLGQSNCGKNKQRLFWSAITSQNIIGTVSYYNYLFYGIVLLSNCNYKLVGCTLPEDWDLKIAENAKIPLFRIFRAFQNAVNLSIFIKFR